MNLRSAVPVSNVGCRGIKLSSTGLWRSGTVLWSDGAAFGVSWRGACDPKLAYRLPDLTNARGAVCNQILTAMFQYLVYSYPTRVETVEFWRETKRYETVDTWILVQA